MIKGNLPSRFNLLLCINIEITKAEMLKLPGYIKKHHNKIYPAIEIIRELYAIIVHGKTAKLFMS